MSNINWGQFLNNFSNNFNGVNRNNMQPARLNLNEPAPFQQNNNNGTTLASLLPNTAMQLTQTLAEMTMLNSEQNVQMLKELLNFPKNFEQLLQEISVNPKLTEQKLALILLASTLDLGKLSSMLKTNAKEAMSNLYQMLAQYNQSGMSLKDEQLNQLTKLISFVAASACADVQSLKTTMLMYLPWLPLTQQENFKLDIAEKTSDNSAGSDDFVSVLISTENYGNIQADIYKTDFDGIKILFVSSSVFPQKDFIDFMREESKKYNININLDMAQNEKFGENQKQGRQTKVCLNTSPGVNPFLLLISNSVIRCIHIIDEKEKLREHRKEKSNNNGES